MRFHHIAASLIAGLLGAATVSAQTSDEPWSTLQDRLKAGDKLTVNTGDGRESRGRFVAGREDAVVLRIGEQDVSVPWADVDRVRRRRNGVLLGAIIGTLAGGAAAYPIYWLEQNNSGDGAAHALRAVLAGTAIGIGIDALLSRNRTLYHRRTSATTLRVEPRRGGAALRLAVEW